MPRLLCQIGALLLLLLPLGCNKASELDQLGNEKTRLMNAYADDAVKLASTKDAAETAAIKAHQDAVFEDLKKNVEAIGKLSAEQRSALLKKFKPEWDQAKARMPKK